MQQTTEVGQYKQNYTLKIKNQTRIKILHYAQTPSPDQAQNNVCNTEYGSGREDWNPRFQKKESASSLQGDSSLRSDVDGGYVNSRLLISKVNHGERRTISRNTEDVNQAPSTVSGDGCLQTVGAKYSSTYIMPMTSHINRYIIQIKRWWRAVGFISKYLLA